MIAIVLDSVVDEVVSLIGIWVGPPTLMGNVDDSVVMVTTNVDTLTDLSLSKLLTVDCPPPKA